MKRITAILCMSSMAAFVCVASMSSPAKYSQPEDNGVRDVKIISVHDGDTVTADIQLATLGRSVFWAHNVRLRLKDVRAIEIAEKPEDQDPQERLTALSERDALSNALFATDAQPVRAYITRKQTYDRYEAVIYTAKQNVNELMLTYPQGGR